MKKKSEEKSEEKTKKLYPGWFKGVNILGITGILSYLSSHQGIIPAFSINFYGIIAAAFMGALIFRGGWKIRNRILQIMGLADMVIWIGVLTFWVIKMAAFINVTVIRVVDSICLVCTGLMLFLVWKYRREIEKVSNETSEKKVAEEGNKKESVLVKEEVNEELRKIDVNLCTAEELTQLPGISVVTAKKMIDYRENQGGFQSVEEFIMKAEIKPHFAVQLFEMLTISVAEKNHKEKVKARKLDI